MASENREEALLSIVVTDPPSNARLIHLKLKGLDPDMDYSMQVNADLDEKILAMPDFPGISQLKAFISQEGRTYKGAALMNGGLTIPWIMGHYPAVQVYFRATH